MIERRCSNRCTGLYAARVSTKLNATLKKSIPHAYLAHFHLQAARLFGTSFVVIINRSPLHNIDDTFAAYDEK
jgi:hypothetical protein